MPLIAEKPFQIYWRNSQNTPVLMAGTHEQKLHKRMPKVKCCWVAKVVSYGDVTGKTKWPQRMEERQSRTYNTVQYNEMAL